MLRMKFGWLAIASMMIVTGATAFDGTVKGYLDRCAADVEDSCKAVVEIIEAYDADPEFTPRHICVPDSLQNGEYTAAIVRYLMAHSEMHSMYQNEGVEQALRVLYPC